MDLDAHEVRVRRLLEKSEAQDADIAALKERVTALEANAAPAPKPKPEKPTKAAAPTKATKAPSKGKAAQAEQPTGQQPAADAPPPSKAATADTDANKGDDDKPKRK